MKTYYALLYAGGTDKGVRNVGEVIDFIARQYEAWERDYKKRRKDQGEHSPEIWELSEWLEQQGWQVNLHDKELPEFHTFADFDNKVLRNNNVKAYHARFALRAVVANVFAKEVGRVIFHWEEVHDEAHRNVRDQEEWKGTKLYGSVWYSREMYRRDLNDGEEVPKIEHPHAIIHPDENK